MKIVPGPVLYVIIAIVAIALLLLILWLLGESRRKKYHEDAVRYMLQPERAPVPLATWGAISAPDDNGVMTCSATTSLDGLNDQVEFVLKSKDLPLIEDFTKSVKFRFSPIYTPLPSDPFDSLLKALGIRRRSSTQVSNEEPGLMKTATSPFAEGPVLEAHDVLLEFGMPEAMPESKAQEGRRLSAKNGKPYYAVAFNIDPTIRRVHTVGACPTPVTCSCGRRDYYSSTERNISVTVSASVGSVNSILGTSAPTLSAGQSTTLTLSNPEGYRRYFSVGGRSLGDNAYGLVGTWYA